MEYTTITTTVNHGISSGDIIRIAPKPRNLFGKWLAFIIAVYYRGENKRDDFIMYEKPEFFTIDKIVNSTTMEIRGHL